MNSHISVNFIVFELGEPANIHVEGVGFINLWDVYFLRFTGSSEKFCFMSFAGTRGILVHCLSFNLSQLL